MPAFINNTITNNFAPRGGGIHCFRQGYPILINSILSGNSNYAIFEVTRDDYATVNNCLFYDNPNGDYYDYTIGGLNGVAINQLSDAENNRSGNPLFVNPLADDFHLQDGSAAIDQGTTNDPRIPTFDFEYDMRPGSDGLIDIGVDEVDSGYFPFPTPTISPTATTAPTPCISCTPVATPTQISPCNIDTLLTALDNPMPLRGDDFGHTVEISGNHAVVGAPRDNPGGVQNAGSAYIFNTFTGKLEFTLNNPSPRREDRFGNFISIWEDIAIVSAHGDDPFGIGGSVGSIYFFSLNSGELLRTITNPSLEMEAFGYGIDVSGNLLVVGAPGAEKVYVFDATSEILISTINYPGSNPHVSIFPVALAISGNLVVVGPKRDDPGGIMNAGIAYVFDAMTGNLVSTLNNPEPHTSDLFGNSVAISGNNVIVGAYANYLEGIDDTGSAYIFNAITGVLDLTLNNPYPAISDWFGFAVSISNDFAVVGSHGDKPGGLNTAGSAYVFDVLTGNLVAELPNPEPESGDRFGLSVEISNNLVIVGAPKDNSGGIGSSGRAYIFTCPSLVPTPTYLPTPCPGCTPYPTPSLPTVTPTPFPDIDVSPSFLTYSPHDFDATNPLEKRITIRNNGTTPLLFSGVEIEIIGIFSSHFSIVQDTGEHFLYPGGQRIVTVGFNPFSYGKKIASLRIYSNDPNRPTVGVRLEGLSNAALINVSKQNLSFNDWWVQAADLSPPQLIQIRNIGNLPLDFMGNEIEIMGAQAASFFIMSDTGEGTLSPGAFRTVEVAFHPIQTENNLAYLSITSTDGDQPTLDVTLLGVGVGENAVGDSWVLYE